MDMSTPDATSTSSTPLATGASRRGEESGSQVDRRITDSNQAWLDKVVDGRYRVIDVIGRGGMGVVYRVEHVRMGKIAAMKVLHRDLAQDAEVVRRFEREAAAISRLHHPHTVQVFDFGTAQGALYLVMELVRGRDLARIIERDGPLPWSRAAPLFAQICGALAEAHELGIVHRDLKPENILITRSTAGRDYAKVLDFGLAKLEQRAAPMLETERQMIVGTPYFMAPEQIRGDEVDARTDIYSLGAVMFEVLTGQHLYTGSTAMGVMTKHLTADADAPSTRAPQMEIPRVVDALCLQALQRDPRRRWSSVAELGAAIEIAYAETIVPSGSPRVVASRSLLGGALAMEEGDVRSELRLRRSDLDAYERSLRRHAALVWTATALLAVGGLGALALHLTGSPSTTDTEHEPNDDPERADRIAPGTPVTGWLGKRRSTTEGDRDIYLVRAPEGRRGALSVIVTGIPNIDLNVTIDQAIVIDEGKIGEGEAVHRRAVEGTVAISVGQTIRAGERLPVENVSDAYTLVATIEAIAGGELEPNQVVADATHLALDTELRGFLDSRSDVDLLRWIGDDGTYNLVVRADGLPLQWRVDGGAARTPGAVRLDLRRGSMIRIERSDRDARGPLLGRDLPWRIAVQR